jgi:hypothetical protein
MAGPSEEHGDVAGFDLDHLARLGTKADRGRSTGYAEDFVRVAVEVGEGVIPSPARATQQPS